MQRHKSTFQAVAILFISVCIAAGPLSTSAYARNETLARSLLQPIVFTPSIEELELTTVAGTAMATAIATPAAIVEPTPGPPEVTISGDTITIDGEEYPIGDTFTDADGIPKGVIEKSLFGDQGYSTIRAIGGDEYRLMWVTDRGQRKYMIVREDDPLFSGPDGFKQTMEDLEAAEELTFDAVKTEIAGLAGIIGAEFAICPMTGGGGCIAAVVTAAGLLIGGFALSMWRIFTEYVPARNNVSEAFVQADLNLP